MARKITKKQQRSGVFSIYILVDGESEKDYLESIKKTEPYCSELNEFAIKISPDIPGKKSLDDQFTAVSKALNDYDRVIWMIDYDVIDQQERKHIGKENSTPKQKFKVLSDRFKKLAEKKVFYGKSVHVIINNPSIEYWYLLHFKETARLYADSDSAEKELRKHFSAYTKNDAKFRKAILGLLKERVDKAIENAKKLNEDDNEIKARADTYKIFDNNLKLLKP